MDLLILGGTGFLGRYLVEAALGDGHRPTLFNRGLSGPGLFPEIEKLEGDRDGDISALRGRSWDAVIDTCGYVPRVVRASARLLADAVGHYTFISSISVYSDDIAPGADEGAQVRELKVLCERAAEETMPGRVLNVRPGLISGPHDPTDRFTYWPRRVAGGEVLAPDHEERKVQYIDVRDLASWIVEMSETIKDVLDWDRATMAGREPAAGLRPEREQELLRAWHGVTL
jgi:2'-hydroxyisoflavone reductase